MSYSSRKKIIDLDELLSLDSTDLVIIGDVSDNSRAKKITIENLENSIMTKPAGLDKEVQFNRAGEHSTYADFKYDYDKNALSLGTNPAILPDNPLAMGGNVNSYLQCNLRNASPGESASADYIITADDGDDTQFYADMGIGNSGYANETWDLPLAHDTYVFGDGGNVVIATLSENKAIKFGVASIEHEIHPVDLICTIDKDGINLAAGKTLRINGVQVLP